MTNKLIQEADILNIEQILNHLWGELNTVNLSNKARTNLENRLALIELEFKKKIQKESVENDLFADLKVIDEELAFQAIEQAVNELSKASSKNTFLAIENLKKELIAKKLTPSKARHALKEITRRGN